MADRKITPIPTLPKEILRAIDNDTLAIFIGAGVSRLLGCMGWDELAKNLARTCFHTKTNGGASCISYKEMKTISQYPDHKKTISICRHILKKEGLLHIFYQELEDSLKPNEELAKSQNIYDEIYGLRGLFITTNIDQHFDNKFIRSRIVYQPKDFYPENIDRTKLYHIHGSIVDKDSIIFTVPQYIERYNDAKFRAFLQRIFDDYVVLFVGYGLAEFELLDFLITKVDSKQGKELRHFTLQGFYRGEENILEFEEAYYNQMGIRILAYEKDERGYHQLFEVIKVWNRQINQTSTYLYDSRKQIEEIIKSYGK